ncbi:Phage protein D [Pandoraea pnomenusa]|uniref:Phage protein D n=1 Tax=Pandoraea pnomenusa TaxID=93220 RepID=A0A379KE98_9BURK|nr:Phage protein D [Pandoraea pnomenusa]
MVASALANQLLSHLDQTGESDASLLTRVAKMFDAIATVKADKLLFTKIGQAVTASGKACPLSRSHGRQVTHHFSVADRESFDSVVAYYQDTRAAKKGQVVVTAVAETSSARSSSKKKGNDQSAQKEPPIVEPTGNTKELRHTYASKTNALRAARAEWQRIQRGWRASRGRWARAGPSCSPRYPRRYEVSNRRSMEPSALGQGRSRARWQWRFHYGIELEMKATDVPEEQD